MTNTYRPQPLWLLMGPMLGAFAGAVTGVLLMWGSIVSDLSSASGSDVLTGLGIGLVIGTVYGGTCGAVVGFGAGIPFVVLVGRHLPREVARRRARALGLTLPPATMLVAAVVLLDVRLSVPHGDDWWSLLPLVASSLLGGALAPWAALTDRPADAVS